ncbi:hypothetical protein C2869_01420 [Saccharobesus litoralis]|uniref:diguanylate cyclase n=1 Tax=Saccharobesus litoralis TaxID=2172099 RepID=A0A2S0VLW7_9ALTE|nr:GGDEF domain-containing protein [Saccharobesus litoralis]AWB65185.1 hypothetical protein C2869_01420 [Saccharobesus litoralis]
MRKTHQFSILLALLALWTVHLFSSCQWLPANEINYFDLYSEAFILLFILFLLWVNIRVTGKTTQTLRLFYGLCLLFIGHVHDLLDEIIIISPAYLSLILENIASDVGIIFITLGLFRWSSEYKAQVNLLKQQKLALTSASNTDSMTGLYNRRFLNSEFKQELAQADLLNAPHTLLMLDLDNFKKFNDRFGHLQGDILIKHAAQIIKTAVRSDDYAFRYGGEEFLVVIQGDLPLARQVAERVQKIYRNTEHRLDTGEVTEISVSIGIMPLLNGMEFEQALNKADQALYQAKKQGKDCIVEAATDSPSEFKTPCVGNTIASDDINPLHVGKVF